MTPELAVAVGAAAGAPARYLLDGAVRGWTGDLLPWGILLVNLTGCLGAGLLLGLSPPEPVVTLIGTGFLGSFTTASALAWDALGLAERSAARAGLLLALHVVPGVALAAAGLALGRAL